MPGPAGAAGGAALIVASGREDRRVLFDVLDALQLDAVYSARDTRQARAFFAEDPSIRLVLLEFAADPVEAAAFCAEVADRVPVIGVVGDAAARGGAKPAGLVEWIASPVRAFDATARIEAALAAQGSAPATPLAMSGEADRYRFVFEGSIDELAIVDPQSGCILDVNAAFVQRSGHARTELIGARIDRFDALLDPAQRSAWATHLGGADSCSLRCRKPRADGDSYRVDMHVRRALRDGSLVHLYMFRDIGELGRCRDALDAVAQLTRSAAQHEGMFDTLARALGEWLAPELVAVVAAPNGPATMPEVLMFHHRVGTDSGLDLFAINALTEALDGNEVVRANGAWRHPDSADFVRANGLECMVALPLCDERQDVLGVLLLARSRALDAEGSALAALRVFAAAAAAELALRQLRERDRSVSLGDPLTGLPNRLLFNDRLELAIREAQRSQEHFALLFVDLDRFKTINDSLGHGVGDQVLIAVANRLRACVRESDTVARYAGDEFTLILRHVGQREDAVRVADKIVRAMEAPLELADGLELGITASLGLSFYPEDATDAERLLKHADVAMYSAKGLGRNNVQAYVAVPEEAHQQRLMLETKLRQAEASGQLRAFYQPQLGTASEDIVGMEALIRWEHPELGMISPGFFIPLAEESGLIISMGEWILRQACHDAQRWVQKFGLRLRVGVNLSALQLRQPGFVRLVAAVLRDSGLPPQLLDLEITESMSMKSIPNLLETLNGLRRMGCGVSIDDFGTGQASLEYMRRFPADRIKIDQAFVRNIGIDPDDEAIVHGTITMAHNLKREVVAEGVESEQHLEFLRKQGCEVVQGFLFCRPLPAAGFERLLEQRAHLLGEMRGAPAIPA